MVGEASALRISTVPLTKAKDCESSHQQTLTDVAGVVVGAGGEGQEEGGRAEAETSNGRNKVAHSNGCKMECAGGNESSGNSWPV